MKQQIICFNSRDYLLRLDITNIAYFEGDGNYTYIVSANSQKSCITMNLSHTENALAEQLGSKSNCFIRIGKRYIVNINFIYQIDIPKQKLTLSDGIHFTFHISISKDALKTAKEIIIRTKF